MRLKLCVIVPVKTMERLKASNYTLQVGEWLNRGEALIYASDDIPTELNEEAAQVLSQKIDEHKAFFSDWNSVKEQASRIAPTLQVLRTYFL